MYNSNLTGVQLDGVYGEISVNNNVIPQSIPSDPVVYTKLDTWTSNGVSEGVTSEYLNGQIKILSAGNYKLEASLSFKSGTGNIISDCSIFVDGVEQNQAHFSRKISTAGDVGSASITSIAQLNENSIVDIRLKHDNVSSVDITIVYGNLNVELVGV